MTRSILPPALDGLDLKSLTYREAAELVASLSDIELLALFDSPSIKIGDCAVEELEKRSVGHLVVEAVCNHRLKTRNGKVRATNFLSAWGRSYKEAFPALMILAADKNKEAVNNALLYVVLWRDLSVLPTLKALYAERKNPDYLKAIEALEKGDHRIYMKYFAPDKRWD
jgi:hypothetical protein